MNIAFLKGQSERRRGQDESIKGAKFTFHEIRADRKSMGSALTRRGGPAGAVFCVVGVVDVVVVVELVCK